MRLHIKLLLLLFLFMGYSCEKEGDDIINCPPFDNIQESPYKAPIWHPTDKIIGFNHIPLKEINYTYGIDCPQQAIYTYEEELAGFYLIDEDGTNKRRILPYELNTPAWSPDGEWIAYDSNRDSPTGLYFIWKMKKNGDEKTRIAFAPNQGEARMPFWGNDFNIVYQQYTDTSAEIFTMDSSGNAKTRLTSNKDRDFLPKYSPNKKLIGFISQSQEFGNVELWTINLSSNEKLKLTPEGCQGFSWSPDGKLVYINYDYSRLDEKKGTLWIMNPDGSEKQQLTHNDFRIIN